ncbi:MAG TPA: phosphoglucosamine mutase [Erysipelotrichaceae bacterium]|nr:phosphoglucosamine mutase [Erysipelotrichaceae bacterium]
MTIGEKITHLRIVNNISQEELAAILKISRQSLSKWENDDVSPSLDKVRELCSLFKVSADELIDDNIVIHKGRRIELPDENIKTKYFGTDGFRGEANESLNSDRAYKIGRFLGWFYSNPKYTMQKEDYRPKIVIGKDTRRSSYMLEYAVAAGAASSGADVELLHVTTTPSVSYIVRQDCFDCGVMITASHNPFYDNGIKIINSHGEKIEDGIAYLAEAYLEGDFKTLEIEGEDLPFAKRENIGTINDYSSGRNRYIGYLISLAKHSMKKLKIGLDTANGAAWMIAKSVFEALGAQVFIINNKPNGLNINLNAGSTHIQEFSKFVEQNKLDVGFAFDGDADRCIAVDENGKVVDGDKILYLLANKLKREDVLEKDTVVATVMSNSGLEKALKQIGVEMVRTQVGDRFVFEKMMEEGYVLGGEQSGHIIIRKYATTGDGMLTAIMIAEEMLEQKETLSKLVSPVKVFPQVLKSVRVTDKNAVMDDKVVLARFEEINKEISDNGRALLRQSGTEPVVRIMVENSTLEKCNEYIDRIYNVIKKRGYVLSE